jgi:hypothetical protein
MHVAAVEMDSPRLEAIAQDSTTDNRCSSTPLVSSELQDEFMRGHPALEQAVHDQGMGSMLWLSLHGELFYSSYPHGHLLTNSSSQIQTLLNPSVTKRKPRSKSGKNTWTKISLIVQALRAGRSLSVAS